MVRRGGGPWKKSRTLRLYVDMLGTLGVATRWRGVLRRAAADGSDAARRGRHRSGTAAAPEVSAPRSHFWHGKPAPACLQFRSYLSKTERVTQPTAAVSATCILTARLHPACVGALTGQSTPCQLADRKRVAPPAARGPARSKSPAPTQRPRAANALPNGAGLVGGPRQKRGPGFSRGP